MPALETKPLELGLLRSLSPLDGLKIDNLQSLSRKTALRQLPMGRFLFRAGDTDKRTYYLVRGTLELLDEGRIVQVVRGGSPQARVPIAPASPRRHSARVASDSIEYLSMDSEMLDVMLTWDQTGVYEVGELVHTEDDPTTGADWMTALLQTRAFHRIPPANIQALFLRMQRVAFQAGDTIITQGDDGDYFYVIAKGSCVVARETPLNRAGIKLAELSIGDTFGEEALISDAKRNASVTAATDVTLMRLGKADFQTLLNEPMLRWVDRTEAAALIARGAKWLDVRLPSEFDSAHPADAINLPLYFLRLKLKSLARDVHYICICDNGKRSSAAAYILAERGFHASVVRGGMDSIVPPSGG